MQGRGALWKPGPWLILVLFLVGCGVPVVGLRPEYPEAGSRYGDATWGNEVDTLRPTLRWEAFPRRKDRELDRAGLLSRVQHVSYDLRIWRDARDYASQAVYRRDGLPTPSHQVERYLARCATYFWTVRARFELDGHPRVTEWGVTTFSTSAAKDSGLPEPADRLEFARRFPIVPNPPNPFAYRFKTPC